LDVQLLVIAAPSTMTNLTLGVELRMGSAVGAGVGGGEASTPGQGSWVEPSFTGGPAKVAAYLENSNTVGGPPNRWMSNVEIEDGRTELPGPLYFGGVRLLAHLVADSPSLATVDLRSTGLGAKPGTWQGIAAFDGERRVHDERMLSPEACASGWLVLGREVAGLDAEFEVTGAYGLGLMWMFAALVPIDLGAWSSGAHMEDVADVVVPTPASSACGF
jgi:hypothetical protein